MLDSAGGPSVLAWRSAVGVVEHYSYPPGPAGRDETHVHADVQMCLSENFPGRYRSGRFCITVPAGSVSVIDAGEPHGAEDPCDRRVTARYRLLYIPKQCWDTAAREGGWDPRVGLHATDGAPGVAALAALYDCIEAKASRLEQEERLHLVLGALSRTLPRRRKPEDSVDVGMARLERARDYIQAHAIAGVTLADAAREAGLSPQHFAASFRARFGLPAHRFQTAARLDRARYLMAHGVSPARAAGAAGFVDQSHLTRHFKKYLHMTPGQYRAQTAVVRTGLDPRDQAGWE